MDSVMKLQRVQLKCKNLHEFLRGLSPGILDRLYNHPATCLAVFRELPGLAKNYVMRMLFLEQPLPQAAVALWVKKEYVKEQEESSDVLLGLRLWHTQLLPGGLQGLVLNPIFKENLRIALLGGGKAWSDDTSQLGPDKHARDVPSLDKYAEERWEVILHFMVGSPSAAVSQDLAQLLSQAGLMKSSEPGEPPCITSAGFQFLLLDTSSQLWYFMLQYLQSAETRGMDLVEILSFLFQLSFSTLGKDYSVEGMSDSLLNFLQHLREFGLVFQRKRKSRRYYPTRLAINLSSGISGTTTDTHNQGFIVVETNYRVYAYTDSELQIALIALFSEMQYRFPNLVVAHVTRESVQQAIANGITAEQVRAGGHGPGDHRDPVRAPAWDGIAPIPSNRAPSLPLLCTPTGSQDSWVLVPALGGEWGLVVRARGAGNQDSWVLFPALGGEWGLVVRGALGARTPGFYSHLWAGRGV
uniref:General transcription factor IIH subunit 4 n=1 Tax=Chelydra serpentina TaxID=8475 RepID=A0A8C3RLF8_CHESE